MTVTYRCDECERTFKGDPHITATGRKLCEACNDTFGLWLRRLSPSG